MSTELSDDTAVEEIPNQARRLGGLGPGSTFLTSGLVGVVVAAAIARNAADYLDSDWIVSQERVAWLGTAAFALFVAVIAGAVYLADLRRRRTRFPRGYRRPQPSRFTIVEILGGLTTLLFAVGVVASAIELTMLIVEQLGRDVAAWAPEVAPGLVLVACAYVYLLLIVPAAGISFLRSRRYKRQYPDESMREGPGYRRTTMSLLVINVVTIMLVVIVVFSVATGQISG